MTRPAAAPAVSTPRKPVTPRSNVERRLHAAHAHCHARGARLTAQRAEVLELLLLRGGQAKAYDLQDDMQARHGRIAPITVYRALEFLQQHHLVHRVETTKSFVVCEHAAHEQPTLLLICTRCSRVQELHDAPALAPLMAQIERGGFAAEGVEVKVLCPSCQAA